MYALCSCNDEQIASNQDNVCEFLLQEEEYKHILIKVKKGKEPGDYLAIFEDEDIKKKNRGKKLEISIEKMQGQLESLNEIRLYTYFESMINLISVMCLQRNYAGINDLEGQYSLDFTIDCFMNPKISYTMRANFAKMLLSLHLDKDPLE